MQFIQLRDEAVHFPFVFGRGIGPSTPLTPFAGRWGFSEESETITWFVIHGVLSVSSRGIIGRREVIPMAHVRVMIVDDVISHCLGKLIRAWAVVIRAPAEGVEDIEILLDLPVCRKSWSVTPSFSAKRVSFMLNSLSVILDFLL